MEDLLLQYAGLAGVAALIAFLINILKTFGVVKDDSAKNWSAALNLVGLAALLALKVFQPEASVEGIDANIAQFVQVGVVVFAYVVQLLGSKLAHETARGVSLIGKSYSVK